MEFASLTARNGRIPCPCNRCVHGKLFLTKVVQDHLYSYGILTNYRPWVFHGESWLATTLTKGGSRAGSMVEQKMQPPKAPSKKKAPKF